MISQAIAIEAAAKKLWEEWNIDGGLSTLLMPPWSRLPEPNKARLRHIATTVIAEYGSKMDGSG